MKRIAHLLRPDTIRRPEILDQDCVIRASIDNNAAPTFLLSSNQGVTQIDTATVLELIFSADSAVVW